jgi:1-aminocyclopropane-1-carboxylate deaminase
MGGPWSNHLHALSYACHELGLPSVGLVRGLRKASDPLTPTLQDCQQHGMQLHFVSREDYRLLRSTPTYWRQFIPSTNDDLMWLPEGGSSPTALRGVAELVAEVNQELGVPADLIICASGSGATLAGIVAGMNGQGKALGIAAVQHASFLDSHIKELLRDAAYPPLTNFEVLTEFDHGGFGKTTPALLDFCRAFSSETGLAIEPVYTGKMLYAFVQLCQQNVFHPEQKIVLVHTGGLQGQRGFTGKIT